MLRWLESFLTLQQSSETSSPCCGQQHLSQDKARRCPACPGHGSAVMPIYPDRAQDELWQELIPHC